MRKAVDRSHILSRIRMRNQAFLAFDDTVSTWQFAVVEVCLALKGREVEKEAATELMVPSAGDPKRG